MKNFWITLSNEPLGFTISLSSESLILIRVIFSLDIYETVKSTKSLSWLFFKQQLSMMKS